MSRLLPRGLAAQLTAPFRLRSEDVPSGEVGEAELLLDPGRLRPLPAARGPEDESDQSIRRGRRRHHQPGGWSFSSAWTASCGPASWPDLLMLSQRRVNST